MTILPPEFGNVDRSSAQKDHINDEHVLRIDTDERRAVLEGEEERRARPDREAVLVRGDRHARDRAGRGANASALNTYGLAL
ncbi:MAG: hypothetical protein HYV09_10930 [Deltaproteobacteria bacterium]|nr:hypothetical protein [Deltaproteobacteria bacterium]